MEPFRGVRDLIITIPGISVGVADVIIAETGADMSRFPTAGHLASWAGTCPGSNESAGRIKSTHTRPGNPYLKGALGVAAMSPARSKDTYLSATYRRIASRRGPIKALVALEHATPHRDLEHDHQRRLLPTSPAPTSTPASIPTRPKTAHWTNSARWARPSPLPPSSPQGNSESSRQRVADALQCSGIIGGGEPVVQLGDPISAALA